MGWLLAVGLALPGPAFAQVRGRVLLIGIDGVRPDVLAAAATPNLNALAEAGYFNSRAQTTSRTVSGPAWSSMLTGVWPEKHGVLSNDFNGNSLSAYPDFLTRAERNSGGAHTLAAVTWAPLVTVADGGPVLSAAIDERILVNGDSVGWPEADSIIARLAAERLARDDLDAVFVYLGNPDVVGHDTGSLSAEYRAAIEAADLQVGVLLDALRRRAGYSDEHWLVLVSTDHGRRDDGGHGQPSSLERTIFVIGFGPGAGPALVADTPGIVDIAVTALTHLGVTIRADWRLDGADLFRR